MASSSRAKSPSPRNDASSVASSGTTKGTDLIRHPIHYYADGSFIFIVENYIFRVYRDLLARRSEVFRDLFDAPQVGDECSNTEERKGKLDRQVKIDGVPAVRLEDKAEDFAALLNIIMPNQIRGAQNYTFDKLSGIYTICDKYFIDDIREWAMSWLEDILPTSENDIHKIGG
ncbi:hypothetical protein FRC01_001997, partial [Tulasnella sp. 417]